MRAAGRANRARAQQALARLASRPEIASRYAGQLNQFQELVNAPPETKPAADELTDLQLDRVELFIEGLRGAVETRKRQVELQARQWELYERELDELSSAVGKKRTKGGSKPGASRKES